MADDPVRVVSLTNDDGGPSSPVRITNTNELAQALLAGIVDDDPTMQEIVDDVIDALEATVQTIDTTGTHVEDPARWEDLRFPAQGINPTGSPAPATVDNGNDYPGTLLFAGNQENIIAGVAQLPHAWKEGTEVHPHIHWSKVTADASNLAVGWELRTRKAEKGAAWSAWSAYGGHTLILGDNTSAELHNLSEFAAVDMTGLKVSCMMIWELRRRGDTDAYNGVTRLLELDFHYQADTIGSSQETIK